MPYTIGFSEVTMATFLSILIFREIQQYVIQTVKSKDDTDKLKARIAVLEHEIQIRDCLLVEYDNEYKTLVENNQKLYELLDKQMARKDVNEEAQPPINLE